MKLIRYGQPGLERPAMLADDGTPPDTRTSREPHRYMTLQPGDLVELGIEGLGRQRQRVIAHGKLDSGR